MAAVIIAPITPVAAASDGVAIPSKISPITEKITMKKGDTLIISINFSFFKISSSLCHNLYHHKLFYSFVCFPVERGDDICLYALLEKA